MHLWNRIHLINIQLQCNRVEGFQLIQRGTSHISEYSPTKGDRLVPSISVISFIEDICNVSSASYEVVVVIQQTQTVSKYTDTQLWALPNAKREVSECRRDVLI